MVLSPLDLHEVRDHKLHVVRMVSKGANKISNLLQSTRVSLGNALDDVEQVAGSYVEYWPRTPEEVSNDGINGRHSRLWNSLS